MVNRVNTLSIYIPKGKTARNPVERLTKLARVKDRSLNYLVVEAILQYLDREERKKKYSRARSTPAPYNPCPLHYAA